MKTRLFFSSSIAAILLSGCAHTPFGPYQDLANEIKGENTVYSKSLPLSNGGFLQGNGQPEVRQICNRDDSKLNVQQYEQQYPGFTPKINYIMQKNSNKGFQKCSYAKLGADYPTLLRKKVDGGWLINCAGNVDFYQDENHSWNCNIKVETINGQQVIEN